MALDRIDCRLRKHKDEDLRRAFETLAPSLDKADVVRAALRAYFNLGTSEYRPQPQRGNREVFARVNIQDEATTREPALSPEEKLNGLLGL